MKFSSMRAYFYRLHNILYITILVPLLTFTYLYLEAQAGMPPVMEEQGTLFYLLMVVYGVVSGLSYGYFLQKIKVIRPVPALGIKLERYATASVVRFVLMALGCAALVLGYWLLGNPLFIVLFMLSLTAFSVYWPSPGKVCKDLRLKGAEREMVFHKKDSLQEQPGHP